ncbi:gamma-glutamyltransferase [Gluconobacter cerinus]|uniref:gamma-glutamyltransferase n=1 Tax=Gluconobacter cerinus TaxID=38307 RepID=UPI001B8C57DB|nr:gamma-glutamyltransferase [Gluconobacter cerinus]MBS1072493.1 gamma-glutamyltransferase [Gluconobacter cerinus]MCW2266194.1 gamma-glutamyltranspeptidase/glutathione hydrolase [Gluconobacter cerinus]
MRYQHWHIADGFSSTVRPAISGPSGAVSAAHPLAVSAGQDALAQGGNAVDAAIAAQAVLCVVAPDACGVGGDQFALVADATEIHAISGAGATPRQALKHADEGANSITVPGLAGAWAEMHTRWGSLPFSTILARAIRLAEEGIVLPCALEQTVVAHDARLRRNGAGDWQLVGLPSGQLFVQPALAALLRQFAAQGPQCFYGGNIAASIARRIATYGGAMDVKDMAAHTTHVTRPLSVTLGRDTPQATKVFVQPPPTQGILLGMALRNFTRWTPHDDLQADHIAVELTEASFAYRDRASEGQDLLDVMLEVDPARASRRGGPRAYLHTAGVSVADRSGMVVSSLISVFDDFGSCIFVPELGIVLNNRAGGFTSGTNAWAPGRVPVHTLAPAIVQSGWGTMALATPGADGQVQTLLQVIDRILRRREDIAAAIAAPRWRSEGGKLLIEQGHPSAEGLQALGHDVALRPAGALCFGAVACAGVEAGGEPFAVSDWRRNNWAGVV